MKKSKKNPKQMKINRELLYKRYMDKVAEIAEECDWVTDITPQDIVTIIATLLEQNKDLYELPVDKSKSL